MAAEQRAAQRYGGRPMDRRDSSHQRVVGVVDQPRQQAVEEEEEQARMQTCGS